MSRAERENDQETPRPSRRGRSPKKQKENNLSRENSLSRDNSPIPPTTTEVASPKDPPTKNPKGKGPKEATKKGPREKTVAVDEDNEASSNAGRPKRRKN